MKFLYYRPEVNGLRGIAVMGAVFYHAQMVFQSFRIFPGGFLGVDVFIVISGYLMTSIILKEYQATQSFSFANYYKRRIRRLLPALLVVIFATSIVSYFVLLPVHFEEFIKSVAASIFFFSNFFFHFSGQAYGAQILSEIPLLHTWSLSLEEQFYIVYPIALLGMIIFMKKKIKLILIIGIFLSIVFGSITSLNHQSFNYYMLPSRGWEFLFGALLGININQLSITKDTKKKGILAIFGFLILLFSFAFFDNTDVHPTYLTLIPVIATYLIIQDTNKENFINRLLSFKILIFLGLISYSFYLWHHPIFSFAKIIGVGDKSLIIKLFFIILSIFLGFLTYKFVEKPFRKEGEQILKIRKINILGVSIILIIITLYSLVEKQKKQYPTIAQDLYQKTWFTTKTYFKPCFQRIKYFCSFNEKKGKSSVFLLGSSAMASVQDNLKERLINKNFNFIPMTGGDPKFYNNKLNKILSKENSTIVIQMEDNNTDLLKSNPKFFKIFFEKVNFLLKKNYKVILIYPIPNMKVNVSKEIEKNLFDINYNKKNKNRIIKISYKEFLDYNSIIFEKFDKISHKNLFKFYPHKYFCNTQIMHMCVAQSEDEVYFVDDLHFSRKGAELFNLELVKIIDKVNK
ncbi:MAG: Peptidoglycan/LPS O-acetylase OafA/YrhL [Pelagibacterales bacterium]|nr:Peptidoglycan/LPS O-acetylase OafA/YrhL [Pelagibacterales bacterium]